MSLLDYAIEGLTKAKRKHLVVEDCWYSCPASGKSCHDEEKKCDCGAEQHNRAIDICIQNLTTMTEQAGELRPSG